MKAESLPASYQHLQLTDAFSSCQLITSPLRALSAGEILIKVEFSGLNYKDALALTQKGKILKKFPLTPGIDAAGVVADSKHPQVRPGDRILVTGMGFGENFDGGLSEYLYLPGELALSVPSSWTYQEAMTLGTAGFTAGLCLNRMEQNGQKPSDGPIIITGASGGVGSLACLYFSQRGYEVTAVTSSAAKIPYLKSIGALHTRLLEEFAYSPRPLEKTQWAGAVDNLGGNTLSILLAGTHLWGNVACVGLAQDSKLQTTVMPHILRGVSLLGISSTNTPYPLRKKIWQDLSQTLTSKQLKKILTQEIPLQAAASMAEQMLNHQTQGRILVRCSQQ